ncbi:MAG: hypothetical protein BWY27_00858 [Bacteroidetes bacterium ADurb.Bin234]|nr:MAG: hypothetical protein BWY27_00858 [Bacteroidetes bacterium ADurb.Bin234]
MRSKIKLAVLLSNKASPNETKNLTSSALPLTEVNVMVLFELLPGTAEKVKPPYVPLVYLKTTGPLIPHLYNAVITSVSSLKSLPVPTVYTPLNRESQQYALIDKVSFIVLESTAPFGCVT